MEMLFKITFLDHLISHNLLLDVSHSAVDFSNSSITIQSLGRQVHYVSHSAQDLDAIVGVEGGTFTGRQFGHWAELCGLPARLRIHKGSSASQQLGRFQSQSHLSDARLGSTKYCMKNFWSLFALRHFIKLSGCYWLSNYITFLAKILKFH